MRSQKQVRQAYAVFSDQQMKQLSSRWRDAREATNEMTLPKRSYPARKLGTTNWSNRPSDSVATCPVQEVKCQTTEALGSTHDMCRLLGQLSPQRDDYHLTRYRSPKSCLGMSQEFPVMFEWEDARVVLSCLRWSKRASSHQGGLEVTGRVSCAHSAWRRVRERLPTRCGGSSHDARKRCHFRRA